MFSFGRGIRRTTQAGSAALLAGLSPVAAAAGDAAAWQAGFGRADVTPDRPVLMAGYASRDKPSEGVEHRLFAKAMALRDADGNAAAPNIPEEHREGAARYTRELQEKLKAVVFAAWDDLKPARLSWGVGVAPFVMNRREFTEQGMILGTNPRGPADRSVPCSASRGRTGNSVESCSAVLVTTRRSAQRTTGSRAITPASRRRS